MLNDTFNNAKKYASASFQNTYLLGYRDLPWILEKYATGKKAIDYGCGAGRSTNFLSSLEYSTLGVDISSNMIKQAIQYDHFCHYAIIKNNQVPVMDNSCDLFFSCFVFFTIETKKELLEIFREAYRVLKKDGTFVFVTGSEYLYRGNWLSYNTSYKENENLVSGSKARIGLKDLDIEFVNYLWTVNDYEELAQQSSFTLVETLFPLGSQKDKINWKDELTTPPYMIAVLKK